MAVRELVHLFYDELWNRINLGIAEESLHQDVSFRGSIGVGVRGRREVCDYILMVTTALSNYRCEIQSLIIEGDRAAAKVRFAGIHSGEFLGIRPPGAKLNGRVSPFLSQMGTHFAIFGCWVISNHFVPSSDQAPEALGTQA